MTVLGQPLRTVSMPIKRFRTLEEAELDLICPKPDAAYFRRLARLLASRPIFTARGIPRGILKYRTMEEADRDAEKWLLQGAMEARKVLRRPGDEAEEGRESS
jgi:hypothetical protein